MSNPRRRLVQSLVLAIAPVGTNVFFPQDPAAADVTATVETAGAGPLNVRSAASTASPRIGTIADGSPATIGCHVTGELVRGAVRTTNRWDRLAAGGYVSHAYLRGSAIGVPVCASGRTGGGTSRRDTRDSAMVATGNDGIQLRVRAGPGTSYQHVGSVRNGSGLTITCQIAGQSIMGPAGVSRQWDRLDSGRYVSHAYVKSGPIPSCPTGTAPAGGGDPPRDQAQPGTIRSDHGPVRIRDGSSTSHRILRWAPPGSSVSIACAVTGQYVSGTVRGTPQWDRLVGGGYVSHAYVRVPNAVRRCSPSGAPGPSAAGGNGAFIADAVEPAQRAWREHAVPVSVVIAQAIIESGWGRSELATAHNNYFGIKCWRGWRGPIASGCASYPTIECEPYCRTTTDSFRTYDSIADSFRDHGTFLTTNSRYRSAFAHSRDANRFLYEVWQAGYATSPTYYDQVTALMREYNLYQYDLA